MKDEMMSTVKIKDLSKDVLIYLVDEMRKANYIPEHLLIGLYKQDLRKQISSICEQLKVIDEALKNKRLSRKAYAALVKKNDRLVALGNKKIELVKGLEDNTSKSKS